MAAARSRNETLPVRRVEAFFFPILSVLMDGTLLVEKLSPLRDIKLSPLDILYIYIYYLYIYDEIHHPIRSHVYHVTCVTSGTQRRPSQASAAILLGRGEVR